MSTAKTLNNHVSSAAVVMFMLCLLFVTGNAAFAIPYLQLDAYPAGYVGGEEESVVTYSSQFTLYALVDSSQGSTLGDFYISVAIIPDPGETSPDLGFYKFDGETFNVTDGGLLSDGLTPYEQMVYGTPPVDDFLIKKGLPGHGVFDTYYREHSFTLAGGGRADLYNSQDNPGGPLQPEFYNPVGDLYYQAFEVDATGLASGSALHFDLYTMVNGKFEFAPFSHDVTHAPVPGAVLLGILGLGVAGVKLRKFM